MQFRLKPPYLMRGRSNLHHWFSLRRPWRRKRR